MNDTTGSSLQDEIFKVAKPASSEYIEYKQRELTYDPVKQIDHNNSIYTEDNLDKKVNNYNNQRERFINILIVLFIAVVVIMIVRYKKYCQTKK